MSEYAKLFRVLRLIAALAGAEQGLPIARLSSLLQTSGRNAYRYLELLRECGFALEQPQKGRWKIIRRRKDDWLTPELITFTLEEAGLLREALHAIDVQHPLRQGLLEKLYALSDVDTVTENIIHSRQAQILHTICSAIRGQKQLHIQQYHSSHSGEIHDRIVEPFRLGINGETVEAYEPALGESRTFKISRMDDAKMMNKKWKHLSKHHHTPYDAFGMTGNKSYRITLLLNLRARNLLIEEHPLCADRILEERANQYRYEDNVYSIEGIGRFVMGLLGELTIVKSTALKTYVQHRLMQIDYQKDDRK